MLLDEAAQANCFLKVRLVYVLVQNTGIGTHLEGGHAAIEATHRAKRAREGDHLRELSNISALLDLLCLLHEVSVDVDSVRIKPGDVFGISNSRKHVSFIVPLEGVDYVLDLVDFGFVNQGEEHVSIAVDKTHLSLARHLDLV